MTLQPDHSLPIQAFSWNQQGNARWVRAEQISTDATQSIVEGRDHAGGTPSARQREFRGRHPRQWRWFKDRQGISSRVGGEQPGPHRREGSSQPAMAAETQTERQRGWLGQLSQPATGPPQATITTYLNPSLRISDCYQLNKPTRTVAHRKGRVKTGTARRCKFQDRTHGALGSYFSRMDNRPRAAVKQVGRAHVCIS